jgi:transposase
VAQSTGYSANWIREVARRYREDGPTGLGDRRHPNPGQAPVLDAAPQDALCQALSGPAPDGGVGTGRWVAHWMSQTLGRPIHIQRGWDWMGRLGFSPQRPRPRETRAEPEAPAAFKQGGVPPLSPP